MINVRVERPEDIPLVRMINEKAFGQEQLIPDDRHTGTLEYFDW
jgi:predicted N-acetyltransferase YhbS